MKPGPWIAALLIAVGVEVLALASYGRGHPVLWRVVLVLSLTTVTLRLVGFLLGSIWRGAVGVQGLHPPNESGIRWLRSRRNR